MGYLTGEEFLRQFIQPDNNIALDSKEDGFVTLKDKDGNLYKANLNESEKERFAETKKPLSQVKKEQKEKKSEKDPKEKTMDYLESKGLTVWEHPGTGAKRVYLNKFAEELLGIKYEKYKTGNLRYFEWEDGQESNSYGNEILNAIKKSYYDVKTNKIVARGAYSERTNEDVEERLNNALSEKVKNFDK